MERNIIFYVEYILDQIKSNKNNLKVYDKNDEIPIYEKLNKITRMLFKDEEDIKVCE